MVCRRRVIMQQGFTLVELVAVIVLLGILSVASTQFISQGVSIYSDSVGRDSLQQQGRFAVERMSRELRNALPGSIRVASDGSTQCVEFMPVEGASTYLEPVADSLVSSLEVVDFSYTFTAGDLLAIYSIDTTSIYDTSVAIGTLTGDSVSAEANQQVLDFTEKQFSLESPTNRMFIVSNPVSFCAQGGSLRRYEEGGYVRTALQPVPPAGGVLLAENIRLVDDGPVTVFSFTSGTLVRSGVVHMDLRFSHAATMGDEWVRFSQEIYVRNTP